MTPEGLADLYHKLLINYRKEKRMAEKKSTHEFKVGDRVRVQSYITSDKPALKGVIKGIIPDGRCQVHLNSRDEALWYRAGDLTPDTVAEPLERLDVHTHCFKCKAEFAVPSAIRGAICFTCSSKMQTAAAEEAAANGTAGLIISWFGGTIPVDPDAIVKVWFNNGKVGEYTAFNVTWENGRDSADVVKYQVIYEKPRGPSFAVDRRPVIEAMRKAIERPIHILPCGRCGKMLVMGEGAVHTCTPHPDADWNPHPLAGDPIEMQTFGALPKEGWETGGTKFDQDKPRFDLIDPEAEEELAKVLSFGAQKYAEHNWRKGIKLSRLLAAARRHINAISKGEDLDNETGLQHAAHAMCCMMFVIWTLKNKPDMDDRYKISVNK